MTGLQNLAQWNDPLGERINAMTREAWGLFLMEQEAFEKLLQGLEQTCPAVQELSLCLEVLAPPEEE